MKTLIIHGAAPGHHKTFDAVGKLSPFKDFELVDLLNFKIHPYNYDQSKNSHDDFKTIVKKMLEAENIIFATPVYWYAMSGTLKNFFDRFSDLLRTPEGRALKGKKTYLIATGSDPELPPGFETPFRLTSEYFEMDYQRAFYLKT